MCHNLSFSTSRRYHTIVFIYPFFYSHVIDTHCTAKELDWRITTIGFANSSHFKIIATKLCTVCYCWADYIWRLPISTFEPLWYKVINMYETSFTEPIYKVNRCLARYSPRATTTNQMSRQGLAQNEQKCHFRAKSGLFWAKNPNFYWRNQKFCYPHNGKPT